MQMQVADLKNLVVLARKGMAAIGESIGAEEAKAAWTAIGNGEAFLANFEQMVAQQQANQEQIVTEGSEEGSESELHVVNLNEDGTTEDEGTETEPKVEDDNT